MPRFRYLLAVVFLTLIFQVTPVLAQQVNVHFFYGEGCPHCGKEEAFLDKLEQERDDVNIFRYEIYHNSDNANLLQKVGQALGADVRGVPVVFIQDEYVGGFLNEEVTGQQIIASIEKCKTGQCTNQIAEVIGGIDQNDDDQSTGNYSSMLIWSGATLVFIIGFAIYKGRR